MSNVHVQAGLWTAAENAHLRLCKKHFMFVHTHPGSFAQLHTSHVHAGHAKMSGS